MSLICEECGKIYHIDPKKIQKYKDKNVKVRCSECNHVTTLSNLMDTTAGPSEMWPGDKMIEKLQEQEQTGSAPSEAAASQEPAMDTPSRKITGSGRRQGAIGLRGKMFLLFFLVPIVLIAISGAFSQWQINLLVDEITGESTELLTEAGAEMLLEKARDVAFQAELYLRANPDLDRDDFAYDPEFSQIAVQAIGESGYTLILQYPEPDQDWTIWAHPNPHVIGIEDIDAVRAALGPHFDAFFELLKQADGGETEITGRYYWMDPDGVVREKFMAIAPIQLEGAPFLLMATSNIEEFEQRTEDLRDSAEFLATQTLYVNMGIFLAAILLIGLCIIIYGYRLTRKIQYLTDVADRISVGDMEAEIDIRSNDEIGSLGDAISRMQDSLRFSIERLRRRRR
ncbi:MAG: HAMP domain-containing protein [Desulfosalsimonadaceae bacterium]